MERLPLEIQRAPVAVVAISVILPLPKGGRDQPSRSGRPEIRNRAFDIRKRQMHQTVAAQDRVASRQRVPGNIDEIILAANPTGSGAGLQTLDQRRYDIDPNIADARGNPVRSVAVASSSEPSPEIETGAPHKLVSWMR